VVAQPRAMRADLGGPLRVSGIHGEPRAGAMGGASLEPASRGGSSTRQSQKARRRSRLLDGHVSSLVLFCCARRIARGNFGIQYSKLQEGFALLRPACGEAPAGLPARYVSKKKASVKPRLRSCGENKQQSGRTSSCFYCGIMDAKTQDQFRPAGDWRSP
jgi:hypothetical protein